MSTVFYPLKWQRLFPYFLCKSAGRTAEYYPDTPINANGPNCRKLQAELGARIARLERTVARLQQELDAARRASKRQAAPFSNGEPQKNPQPPGCLKRRGLLAMNPPHHAGQKGKSAPAL